MNQRVSLSPSHLTPLFSIIPHSFWLPNEPFKNYGSHSNISFLLLKNNYNISWPKEEHIWMPLLTKAAVSPKFPSPVGWKPMGYSQVLTIFATKLAEIHINLITSLDGREIKRGKAFLLAYFFRLPPTLQDEYVSIDVLHTDPAGEAQGRVCPHPVHHSPQLSQKRNKAEPARKHILLERQLWGRPRHHPNPRSSCSSLLF